MPAETTAPPDSALLREADLRPSQEQVDAWRPAVTEIAPVQVSTAYKTYWQFAYERQQIYMRRLAGQPAPWTSDPVLRLHRFTNAYRASDRVSQYLIKNVIYTGDQSPAEVFFRAILFRMFNKIETWEFLSSRMGAFLYRDRSLEPIESILLEAVQSGGRLYSPAYIMPPVHGSDFDYKFQGHLALLDQMMREDVADRVVGASSLEEVFLLLRSYPGLGDFLAFQFTIDLNYSEICNFAESDFVVAGPGASSGIAKCFTDLGGLSEQELIHLLTEIQQEEFDRLGLHFSSLSGRPLQPIDLQNLFCEVDKYSRVAHPDIQGANNRTRIKQKYKPVAQPLPRPWFPPKWGINDEAATDSPSASSERLVSQPSLFP